MNVIGGALKIPLENEAATEDLARRIAALAVTGDVIALQGDLGSGKTSFARAFIRGLASATTEVSEQEEVPSPTFTLVQIYDRRPANVWHFDLYRIENPEEIFELGIEEAMSEGITLIEWPERLGRLLPAESLVLRLDQGPQPDMRVAFLEGPAGWRERLRKIDRNG